MLNNLRQLYGNIDIYLFDQLLKGRFDNCTHVLDAGCGSGRNLVYFLRNGYHVYAIDPDPEAVAAVREMAAQLAPATIPAANITLGTVEEMPFGDQTFDLVISSAVLHFAHDEMHFAKMLLSMWRVLKPGGYFFARLASDIGIETLLFPTGNGRYILPDSSERFLVTEQMLHHYTHMLGGRLFEPIKTTNVQNLRCMTTWCLQKV